MASKAVVDQQADESQTSSVQVAQQRIGDVGYNYDPPVIVAEPQLAIPEDHHHHEHHEEQHDPGFWKKKVTWKEGWKKYWVSFETSFVAERLANVEWFQKPGKKQVWKADWKKIYVSCDWAELRRPMFNFELDLL